MQDTIQAQLIRRRRLRLAVEVAGYTVLSVVVAASAVVTKEVQARSRIDALSAVGEVRSDARTRSGPEQVGAAEGLAIRDPLLAQASPPAPAAASPSPEAPAPAAEAEAAPEPSEPEYPLDTRWFNARPVRPARTMWMTVTAYSPDERSCGDSADGITSSIHNVYTNAMKLVAADSRILPLGSMISVPGYDDGRIVPVLDRGGAIKGHRLDVLFPTHEQARKWGVRRVKVTVWEYADGKPKDDFRKIRDSRY